jgi:hypothetical protein
MVRLECDYTTTDVIVTVPATTGTVSVPTTADTIDEVDETIATELFRLRVQLSITMPLLWQRSPCFGY